MVGGQNGHKLTELSGQDCGRSGRAQEAGGQDPLRSVDYGKR